MFFLTRCVYVAIALLSSASFVYGYIDLGTGSYAIQVVLGALVGLLYTIKVKWIAIRQFLNRFFKKK